MGEIAIEATSGDCTLTPSSLPDPDRIVGIHKGDVPRLYADNLTGHLRFLELLVLYERLLILPTRIDHVRDPMKMLIRKGEIITVEFKPSALLELERKTLLTLQEKQVLFIADNVVPPPEVSTPVAYIRKYLELSSELQNQLEERKRFWAKFEDDQGTLNESEIEQEAIIDVARRFGATFMITECCRVAGLPYYLSDEEAQTLRWVDDIELRLRTGVLSYLKDQLDLGAKQELESLSQLGVPRTFPSTPIASMILDEAQSPDDFLSLALQLRDKFSKFRRQMLELEQNLYDENVSISRKLQIAKAIQALADELWPKTKGNVYKETLDITGLLSSTLTAGPSIPSVTKLLVGLISSPTEMLKKALRRRKIRVLLKVKKNFLATKSRTSKISQLFGLSSEAVRESISKSTTSD